VALAFLVRRPGVFAIPKAASIAHVEENAGAGGLDETEDVAGPERMACDQVLYHLGERAIEHAVIPWCEAHGAAVTGMMRESSSVRLI
jgi:diketogulonate reductase-like aldo/keto reductase